MNIFIRYKLIKKARFFCQTTWFNDFVINKLELYFRITKESTIDLIALSKGNTQAFDCLGLYQNVNNAVALLVGGEVCPPEKTCSVYYSQGRDISFFVYATIFWRCPFQPPSHRNYFYKSMIKQDSIKSSAWKHKPQWSDRLTGQSPPHPLRQLQPLHPTEWFRIQQGWSEMSFMKEII